MTDPDQTGCDPRLDWAPEGAATLARSCPVLVVVDVLRFTTAVEVAVARGAEVVPRPWPVRPLQGALDGEAPGRALPGPGAGPFPPAGAGPSGAPGAATSPASRPGAGPVPDPGLGALSPVSLLGVPAGARLELASPNGAMVALAAAGAGAVVLAGCLRNASAVAAAARGLRGPVGVVAAGERRPDGSLRPAVEDLVGAGAILHALGGRPSPEARSAVAAFLDAAPNLEATLADCASGRELAVRGHAADLPLAAAHDVSRAVPVLVDGAFAQPSWPG